MNDNDAQTPRPPAALQRIAADALHLADDPEADQWRETMRQAQDQADAGGGYGDPHLHDAELPDRRAQLTWASSIPTRSTQWAWRQEEEPGRLPAAGITIAAGREGTGKSTFAAWITAQLTRGTLPGTHHGTPQNVFYIAVEDSWSRTITPRLKAAGADLARVARFEVVTITGDRTTLSLPADLGLLAREIKKHDVVLVVLDPLISAVSGKIDTHRESEVRSALEPLAGLCEETGVSVLGIGHFNKSSSTDPASLLTGSGAFKNVARAMFGFARDDDGSLVFSQVKNSLGALDEVPSLGYRLAPATFPADDGGQIETSHLEWTGPTDRHVRDVIRDSGGDQEDRDERDALTEFLAEIVAEAGGQISATDGQAKVKDLFGPVAKKTLQRARKRAGITSKKTGYAAGWVWELPEGVTEEFQGVRAQKVTPSTPSVTPSQETGPAVPDSLPCLTCQKPATECECQP